MPRRAVTINKTNQARIDKWIKHFVKAHSTDSTLFESVFNDLVLNEVKNHKECTEKSVVAAYMDAVTAYVKKYNITLDVVEDDMIKDVTAAARKALAVKYTSNQNFNNNIDIYFNEVKREYILHPMNESDSLEFIPENRDIFIKNNLKLVVNCAKRYRGLGLPFEDLIQIGNYGLLVAFDKFDTKRANLRQAIISNIDNSENESFSYKDACALVKKSFTYDKDLERTLKSIPQNGFATKEEFHSWVMANVKTAVFASVAFQWIKAYILLELSKVSSIVKMPKSSSKSKLSEEEIIAGVPEPPSIPSIVSLDSINPHTQDNYHDNQMASVATEQFAVEDAMIDNQDNEKLFRDIIYKAIASLSDINRRIIKKRFGIGFPCPLNIPDIAESEGLTTNRVKYIISSCLQELNNNISKQDRAVLIEIFGSMAEEKD